MADIVERLLQLAERERPYGSLPDALEEAAAEIERLRAGGCARDQGTTQYCAEAARLAAEIERLRAALEPFAAEADCWPDHHDDEPLVESFPEYDGKINVGACRRARAALEGK